ncbi:MAG: DNA adenine methylase, partial [Bacteroidales bacterium]|nr:DNA adenine methylase [Candidatus Cacconaster equifaecalis]
DGFDDDEQQRLSRFIDRIAAEGSAFVASNSDPKNVNPEENFFDKLYHKFTIKRVSAARMINSNPNGRGCISEIMISNAINV